MSNIKPIKENDSDSESESVKSFKRFKVIEERVTIFCVELFIYVMVLGTLYVIYSSIMDNIEFEKLIKELHKDKYKYKYNH